MSTKFERVKTLEKKVVSMFDFEVCRGSGLEDYENKGGIPRREEAVKGPGTVVRIVGAQPPAEPSKI